MRTNTPRATLVLGLLVAAAATAWAHEKGVLTPATRTPTAGDTLAIAGAKFTKRTSLSLTLVGIGGRIALDTVRADSAGGFSVRVLVPGDAAPGAYRLVAVATDGDEVAAVDVTVVAAAPATDHAAMGHPEGATAGPAATAEPLRLSRARSAAVTWSAVGGIVLALALGGVLLRRPPRP